MQKQTTYQQLQPEDRITIASMRQRGFSVRAIARTLERAPSTIGREVARNISAVPDKVTMDKSGANQAALEQLNKEREIPITIRQVKYLNNIVEQDHRAIKCITRPMLGFQSFRAARAILAGIELMNMIRKGQFMLEGEDTSFADQFYALAG